MSRQRYRTKDPDRVREAMGYVLAGVSALAAGQEYPLVLSVKDARKWAQKLLDEMVAEGYIEPRPGEQERDTDAVGSPYTWSDGSPVDQAELDAQGDVAP